MSTRAFIGIKNNDGTETGIYCHSGLHGRDNIRSHFKTEASVKELLSCGSISCVYLNKDRDLIDSYYGSVGNAWQFRTIPLNGCLVVAYVNRDGTVQEPAYTIKKDEWPFFGCAFKFIFNPQTNKWHTVRVPAMAGSQ